MSRLPTATNEEPSCRSSDKQLTVGWSEGSSSTPGPWDRQFLPNRAMPERKRFFPIDVFPYIHPPSVGTI